MDLDSRVRVPSRGRVIRALALAVVVLLGLTLLTVFLAGGWDESAAQADGFAVSLRREVCRNVLPFIDRTPNHPTNLCEPSP